MEQKNYPATVISDEKETTSNTISELCDKKTKNFIPNAINPNNGAAFKTYSDPLSSKGN